MLKSDAHIFGGMQRDLSVSKQKPEFLWDAHNIRLTAREGDTMLSVTNEKGTSQISGVSFTGTYLGHCVINDYLVVFTTYSSNGSKTDYIYRVDKGNDYSSKILYQGNLNFQPAHPIETLGIYENELVQKVYWVDGLNQPRVINIVKDQLTGAAENYKADSFNFVRNLALNEKVFVERQASSSGQFQSGVIQYAITYFDKYMQETNIAYVTPLYYISFPDRGGSPEEKVGVSFKISIKDLDENFDYVRIYSIYRSSLNGTPVVKRLTDIPVFNVDIKTEATGGVIEPYYRCSGVPLITAGTKYMDTPIYNFESYLEETEDSGAGYGWYFHFTKEEFPNLAISVDGTIITWGDNTEFWISQGAVNGPGDINKRIITGGIGPSGFNGIRVNGTPATYTGVEMASYVDNGTTGEVIDPTSLLYVGGEEISASTLAHKDGTLFLGNIKIQRPPLPESFGFNAMPDAVRTVLLESSTVSNIYSYKSLMDATTTVQVDGNNFTTLTNAAGFKSGDTYRFGVQLQYETGKWSDPVFLEDAQIAKGTRPSLTNNRLSVPMHSISVDLKNVPSGYKRARGVVVFPNAAERNVIAQGIATPTVFNVASRENGIPYVQSSWFFRPYFKGLDDTTNSGTKALEGSIVEFRHNRLLTSHGDRGAEIQGVPLFDVGSITISDSSIQFTKYGLDSTSVNPMDATSLFAVDREFITVHGPDIEFDDSIDSMDLNNVKIREVGSVTFTSNMGDISIQTSSPTIHPDGSGFIHRAVNSSDPGRILAAGLFYGDYLVDDDYEHRSSPKDEFLFMVYPWHKSGSLNNDCVRPADKGARSAVLSQKKISNIRFSGTTSFVANSLFPNVNKVDVKLFNSDQVTMLKFSGGESYYGNIDTLISPIAPFGVVFSTANKNPNKLNGAGKGSFTAHKDSLWFLWRDAKKEEYEKGKILRIENGNPNELDKGGGGDDIGDSQARLVSSKEGIRMKYKSTKHVVVKLNAKMKDDVVVDDGSLPLVELYRDDNSNTIFGGTSTEAKRANTWLPAGEPVTINREGYTTIDYIYGDTWYQRYDCLKTYPFTLEDENSIVEIASFLVESRVNADGRYDKNRGNASNLVAMPINFNLYNPVYSQPNNFFSYRMLDTDMYKLNDFQNSVVWSLNKQPASIVDSWTEVTIANILDLDGNMGAVTALETLNDNIYCFQERGISQIMFNSRVQIPASDGVPIEISNNYKVDGNRYISDSIGVKNKWSIVKSNSGLYFVDSTSNSLYNLGEGFSNISATHGFSHWFDTLNVSTPWTPLGYTIKSFYDKNKSDLYISTLETCLDFSETLGQFTSFMSYENVPAMFNIGQDFYAIKDGKLWQLFNGEHNMFFGSYKPFDLTYVSNQDSSDDKTFTNIELRADFYEDNTLQHRRLFDYIRSWNEYQDTGDVALTMANAKPSNLKKKFRIWRIDIPRDKDRRLDRIRNTWTYVKLGMYNSRATNLRMELHDIVTRFFS